LQPIFWLQSASQKKFKIHQHIVDKRFYPQYIAWHHVVSAQKRGLPGPGEIAEVPHFFIYFSPLFQVSLMAQEKVVSVQIYNQTYHLSCDDQDPAYVQRAAAFLDGKMREAEATVGSRSPLDIAILAALDIAEEVLAARREREDLLDEADQRISTFTRLLEGEDDPPSSSSRL